MREGDTLVVTRLDRLARSTLHLCQIAAELARKQVHLQVLDQHLDTSDATGRLLFHMLGAIAQFETELRAEPADGWDSEGQSPWGALGPEKALDATAVRDTPTAPPGRCAHHRAHARVSSLESKCYRYLGDREAALSTSQR